LALALALGDAHAQDLEAARACTRLVDDVARLACYDAALGVAKPPKAQRSDLNKADAQAQFGDNGQLHRDLKSKTDLPKTVTSTVHQVASLAYGLYRLTLDNGETWQTVEAADWTMEFKAGEPVIISRVALGGYQISLPGYRQSVGAKRIR